MEPWVLQILKGDFCGQEVSHGEIIVGDILVSETRYRAIGPSMALHVVSQEPYSNQRREKSGRLVAR